MATASPVYMDPTNSGFTQFTSGDTVNLGTVNATSITLGSLVPGSVPFAGPTSLLTQDNLKFFWDNTNKRLGIGTNTPVSNLDIAQTVTATGILRGINYTGVVNTNQTLSTEIPAVSLTTAGRQWATGALTTQREVLVTQPLYSFVGASVITTAATVAIAGAPQSSTNATITTSHGLLIQAGAVQPAGAVTTAYGLSVYAPTGASNNYAGQFTGLSVPLWTYRTTSLTNQYASGINVIHSTDQDMVDNFGSSISLAIRDNAGVINNVAVLAGYRAGADNTGDFAVYTYLAGAANERMRITSAGRVGLGSTVASPGDYLDVSGVRIPGVFTATASPTGFPVAGAGGTLTWTDGTRTLSLGGSSFTFYINGVLYTKASGDSIQIPAVTGLYFLYYDASGNLLQSTTFPGNSLPFVATVYWNNTSGKGLLGQERHGISMDAATHNYLHSTIGTRYVSGLTGTFTGTTYSIASGTLYDEDVPLAIGTSTTGNVLYKNASADWVWDAAAAIPYHLVGGRLTWNNGNTLTAVTGNGNYIAYWVFGTNDPTSPIMVLTGQRNDASLGAASAGATYDTLSFGTLPYREFKLLYSLIYRDNGGTITLQQTDDYRSVSNVPSGSYVASAHNLLSGLTVGDDHTQYALLAGRAGGQTFNGGTASTDTLTLQSTSSYASNLVLYQGNVGVGASPTARLYVADSGTIALAKLGSGMVATSTADNQAWWGSNNWGWTGAAWSRTGGTAAAMWGVGINAGCFEVWTAAAGDAASTAPSNTNTRLHVANDGKIGMGVVPSTHQLEISKNQAGTSALAITNTDTSGYAALFIGADYSGTDAYLTYVGSAVAGTGVLQGSRIALVARAVGGLHLAAADASGTFSIYTGGGSAGYDRLSITNDGKILAGSGITPAVRFHAYNATGNTGIRTETASTTNGDAASLGMYTGWGNWYFQAINDSADWHGDSTHATFFLKTGTSQVIKAVAVSTTAYCSLSLGKSDWKLGFYGAEGAVKAATPATLGDVIAILQGVGLCS